MKECVLCTRVYSDNLTEKFMSYYLCYKCALRINKKHDAIFSEEKDYGHHEALNRTLKFADQENETNRIVEFIFLLSCQKFPLESQSIKAL